MLNFMKNEPFRTSQKWDLEGHRTKIEGYTDFMSVAMLNVMRNQPFVTSSATTEL